MPSTTGLDSDPDKNGSPSDHKIVYMKPIDSVNNNPGRKLKIVKFRPLPQSGIAEMGNWIVSHDWTEVLTATTAHEKASLLQSIMLEKLNLFLPEKIAKFTAEDQVWITSEIKDISRRKRREYYKHRKSPKWKTLEELFQNKCQLAKQSYYENIVSDLKLSNPGQWYSKLKRMTCYDQTKSEQVMVESISHLSDKDQAEKIADSFSKVSNQYDEINPNEVVLNPENNKETPKLEPFQVKGVS